MHACDANLSVEGGGETEICVRCSEVTSSCRVWLISWSWASVQLRSTEPSSSSASACCSSRWICCARRRLWSFSSVSLCCSAAISSCMNLNHNMLLFRHYFHSVLCIGYDGDKKGQNLPPPASSLGSDDLFDVVVPALSHSPPLHLALNHPWQPAIKQSLHKPHIEHLLITFPWMFMLWAVHMCWDVNSIIFGFICLFLRVCLGRGGGLWLQFWMFLFRIHKGGPTWVPSCDKLFSTSLPNCSKHNGGESMDTSPSQLNTKSKLRYVSANHLKQNRKVSHDTSPSSFSLLWC